MTTAPTWFKVASFVALLWNLFGCFAFYSNLTLTPEQVAKMPEAQQALQNAQPDWVMWAMGVAVIGGALGSVGLLLRKKWALPVLILSLVGLLIQDVGLFVLLDGFKAGGVAGLVLQGVILAVSIGLVMLARRATGRGWLA